MVIERTLVAGVMVVARRVSLSSRHCQALFGVDAFEGLIELADQTWVSSRKVIVRGPSGEIQVSVMAGAVPQTRVELAITDHQRIDAGAKIRLSGSVENSPGCALCSPQSTVFLADGILNAPRRLELDAKRAAKAGIKDGDVVQMIVNAERTKEFADVVVRVRVGPTLLCLNVDEAATVDVDKNTRARLLTGES